VALERLDDSTIYATFVRKWADRETLRYEQTAVSSSKLQADSLIKCWEIAAWLIYERRHLHQVMTRKDFADSVLSVVEGTQALVESPAFNSLLTFARQKTIVTGMFHEQFLEYLLARAFVNGCTTKSLPFPRYLEYHINFYVNRFIKLMWLEKSEKDLLRTLKHLKEVFRDNLSGQSPKTVNARVNAVYYISRVPMEDRAIRILRGLLQEDVDLYTKNGILFALVRLGDRSREKELYNALISNEEADSINRGLHLVYFRDWNPSWELPPYRDKAIIDWPRTLIGMMNHVESDERRFINSRRLDIYIIRSFLQSRRCLGTFTEEHLNRIRASIENIASQRLVSSDYLEEINHEFSMLQSLAERLSD